MVFERRGRSPDHGGPMRHGRHDRGHGGPRLVPYAPRRMKGENQARRCYVNNLPYDLRWQQFKDHMKQAGNVTFVEIFEDGGKSLGCGLVEYSKEEDAKTAIETLTGSKLEGREIKVKADEPRFYPKIPEGGMGPMGPIGPPGPGGPMGPGPMDMGPPPMGGPGPNPQSVSNVVFVSNLSYEITPKFLRDTFKAAGEILKVNLERDRDGKSKGFGTVVFGNPDMAMCAIDMFDARNIKGRKMSVRLDRLTAVTVPNMGGPGPMSGPGHHMGGPGPMDHGPMGGPGPMDHGSNMGSGNSGGHNAQQSQLLQSIGLAAISSMLQGGGNSMISGLFNNSGSGGMGDSRSGSALENMLSRDTLEGLLRTQNVGGYNSSQDRTMSEGRDNRDYNSSSRGDDRRGSYNNPADYNRGDRHNTDRYDSNKYSSRSEPAAKNKIFVRNIPFSLNNQQLRDYFRHAGHIVDCNILLDKKQQSRGCGTVCFDSPSEAERAVNMFHRSHLQGREVEVRIDN